MILRSHVQGFSAARLDAVRPSEVATVPELCAMREVLATVRVDDGIVKYIADIIARSRTHPSVYLGASPRGSIGLLCSARALAASLGRDFVVPDDVKALAPAILRHRLLLLPDAEIEGVSADDCVEQILRDAKVPHTAG